MLEIRKLSNGIRLIMDPVKEVESVTLGIWIKTGSLYEEKKYAGISHFVEHMMFKGTEKRSYSDISREIDRIGGSINAFTGKEATCYHVKLVSSKLFKGADVLVDMITRCFLTRKGIHLQRKIFP